jgi:hypothetical protein
MNLEENFPAEKFTNFFCGNLQGKMTTREERDSGFGQRYLLGVFGLL